MPIALDARHLTKVYPHSAGRTPALKDVSLSLESGRIHGLIGRNGAGKTTFVRISATQLAPSDGSLTVLGLDVRTEASKIRERIAVIPQESRPLYFLTVDELIFFYLRMRGMERSEARRRTEGVLQELGLRSLRRRLVSRLSGGMRRRAMVAMVLASDAEFLFLDEPTTGLDPLARREVWEAVRRARSEHRTVLLTTHYLDEAESLSDRLALLEGGELKLVGTPAEIRERVSRPYRVTVPVDSPREELEAYGTVSTTSEGTLVFAREKEARELTLLALGKGWNVSVGPVSLEDIFLEIVGRRLDEETEMEGAA